jgi:hypothetical protein
MWIRGVQSFWKRSVEEVGDWWGDGGLFKEEKVCPIVAFCAGILLADR